MSFVLFFCFIFFLLCQKTAAPLCREKLPIVRFTTRLCILRPTTYGKLCEISFFFFFLFRELRNPILPSILLSYLMLRGDGLSLLVLAILVLSSLASLYLPRLPPLRCLQLALQFLLCPSHHLPPSSRRFTWRRAVREDNITSVAHITREKSLARNNLPNISKTSPRDTSFSTRSAL